MRRLLEWGVKRLEGVGIASARLDAEVLLADCLECDRSILFSMGEGGIPPEVRGRFKERIERRAEQEPVAYILGRKEFWSLDLMVNRSVLIPRPETELLVEEALSRIDSRGERTFEIADIGTGSGAISVALAKERENTRIWAVDCSQAALQVAHENAIRHGVVDQMEFYHGDLCRPLWEGRVALDLLVANLPYISRSELDDLPADIKDYEPREALDGGEEGLDLLFRLIEEGRGCLRPGGWLLLEIGWDQVSEVLQKMKGIGYQQIGFRCDLQGIPRVVWGRGGMDGSASD